MSASGLWTWIDPERDTVWFGEVDSQGVVRLDPKPRLPSSRMERLRKALLVRIAEWQRADHDRGVRILNPVVPLAERKTPPRKRRDFPFFPTTSTDFNKDELDALLFAIHGYGIKKGGWR